MLPAVFTLVLTFLFSLFVLIKASGYFTDSAEKIGIFLKIPIFIIGVTIMAFGTSLPELVSSILAVSKDSSEIVLGNVIGSNITNIFLILGLTAIIGKKLDLSYEIIHVDLPLFVGSAFILGITLWDGRFTFAESLLCISGLIIYLMYTLSTRGGKKKDEIVKKTVPDVNSKTKARRRKLEKRTILTLLISAGFIYLGAEYTIDSIIKLAEVFSIGKEIIAMSALAVGTSLPELVVSVTAASRGKPELAIGNILGSNIFNAFGVVGIASLFGEVVVTKKILAFPLPMMIIGTLMFFFMTQEKQVTRWEGALLILFYLIFIGNLFFPTAF